MFQNPIAAPAVREQKDKSSKGRSPPIRDAGMAIESSRCEYVYISDDIGLWGVGVWSLATRH